MLNSNSSSSASNMTMFCETEIDKNSDFAKQRCTKSCDKECKKIENHMKKKLTEHKISESKVLKECPGLFYIEDFSTSTETIEYVVPHPCEA